VIAIAHKGAKNAEQVAAVWRDHWGGDSVVSRGRVWRPRDVNSIVAAQGGRFIAGLLTWHRHADDIKIVSLDSFAENNGVGTALLAAAAERALQDDVRRLWLVTTNDNIRAIRFYRKRGWEICAIHRDAIAQSRRLKPQIPLTGNDGIAIRHEIEFELNLDPV
jgi:ribosomal protein S18 acetylase RimI-like enzyme